MVDERLTLENTGFYAGDWYRLPDGTKRYWTVEEAKAQDERAKRAKDDSRDASIAAVRGMQEKAAKKNAARAKRAHEESQRTKNHKKQFMDCEVCGSKFQKSGNKVTCSPICQSKLSIVRRQREAGVNA